MGIVGESTQKDFLQFNLTT